MRLAEALHAPALLVDQDGCVGPPHDIPEGSREMAQLIRRIDVAPEQDEAPGLGLRQEVPFSGVEGEPGTTADEGADHNRPQRQLWTTKQDPPLDCSCEQSVLASVWLKPPTLTR